MKKPIECFHSRDQHLCKFIGTKESVCIRKEFNSHRIGLGHQHVSNGYQGARARMYWHNLLCAPKSLDKWCSSIRALCMLSVRGTRYVQDSRNPRKIIKKGAYLRCWNLLCLPYPSTSVCTGGRARTLTKLSRVHRFPNSIALEAPLLQEA